MKLIIGISCSMLLLLFNLTECFALSRETHPLLNEEVAAGNFTGFALDDYLINQLGFQKGSIEVLTGEENSVNVSRNIKVWLSKGGEYEDHPPEISEMPWRTVNHFHTPLEDDLDLASINGQLGTSAVKWAQLPEGTQNLGGSFSWQDARFYFHKALTSISKTERENYFSQTFRAVGQVLHMLQDMTVPEHTRNDMHIPAIDGSEYEGWVKKNVKDDNIHEYLPDDPQTRINVCSQNVQSQNNFFALDQLNKPSPFPDAPVPIAWLFDTNLYNENSPEVTTEPNIGLSEYTSANFVSGDTIFGPLLPFPARTSVTKENCDIPDPRGLTPTVKRDYWLKTSDGDTGYILAGIGYNEYYFDNIYMADEDRRIIPPMDKYVLADYATLLLPKAMGYSSNLLEYFFRGNIEITQPDSGGYAIVLNSTDAFDQIKLRAQNTSPDGEEMSGGTLNLVIKYKLYQGDPFANPISGDLKSENFYYSIYNLSSGPTSIPANDSTELAFAPAPESTPVPLHATDVSLQLVYRGQLGQEADAVAVGFKDIGEPTPIDIFNQTDQVCLNGNWYDSGSASAIAVVDFDGNGIADPDCALDGHDCESDVYPHNILNVYLGIYPADRPANPTATEHDVHFAEIPAGNSVRIFALTDYSYTLSLGAIHDFQHFWSADEWVGGHYQETQRVTSAIRNQYDYITDESICSAHGLPTPCEGATYPEFKEIDGLFVFGGIILENPSYPTETTCPAMF